MTENEAIELIEKDLKLHSKDLSSKYKNGLRLAIQCLEDIQQYRAIGTIEEFKVLKNTDIPIIHGKAELDLNDNEVRNKAIDEFVIKLKRVRGYGLITNFDRPFGVTFNKLDEIAEEMKGGAE